MSTSGTNLNATINKMDDSSLIITDDVENATNENCILIQDLVSADEETSYQELKDSFMRTQITDWSPFSLYQSIWKHIMLNKKGALLELILIHEGLKKKIGNTNANKVHVDLENDKYKMVLKDVKQNVDIDIQFISQDGVEMQRSQIFIKEWLGTVSLFAQQILWLIYSFIIGTESSPKTVIFPYPDRESSVKPVVNSLNYQYGVDHTPRFVTYILDNYPRKWKKDEIFIRDRHISIQGLYMEIKFFARVLWSIFISHSIEKRLQREILNKTGSRMPHVAHFSVTEGIRRNVLELTHVVMMNDVLSQNGVEQIIIGGNSPRERALATICKLNNVSCHYIPHSVVHPKETMSPVNEHATMYVEGDFGKEYIERHFEASEIPEIVPLGRPYFQDLLDEAKQYSSKDISEKIRIAIATQADENYIRKSFIRTVLDCVFESRIADEIIIKTHPVESPSYYKGIVSEFNNQLQNKVSIQDDNLSRVLRKSDILLTINSNVAIEAAVVGTPCITYNEHMPVVPSYPYVEDGPVPVFESEADLRNFFNNLSAEKIRSLTNDQMSFAREAYVPNEDVGKMIAKYIEDY